MPRYDADRFQPAAPVALAELRDGVGSVARDVELLIDTGADVTLLPRSAVAQLAVEFDPSQRIELQGFEGSRASFDVVELELRWLGRSIKGRYVVVDAELGILGRDVLAAVRLMLDGPAQHWDEHVRE